MNENMMPQMSPMEKSLMPQMSEPVERRLFDALGAGAKEKDGGVVAAAFPCINCEGHGSYSLRQDCYKRCRLPNSNGPDYFGITSATVKD
jgi:hypothetical protein